MIPHGFTSEGFVMMRRNFSEADRIIDLYTRDKGKMSIIAKGVRRPGSRKRGHLEIFSKVRFQAVNGKGLGIMTEVETINDYKSIRKSIKKVALAYYFMEVLGKAVHEGEGNTEIYDFLSDKMDELTTAKKLKVLRLEFVTNLLKLLGYWPRDMKLDSPDEKLEEVLERQIYSKRVGKIMLK